LDDRDVRILRVLERDARNIFAEIARDLGVSIDTITKRFKKMQEIGVLKRTTILQNPRALGVETIASLELDVDYSRVDELVSKIRGYPWVVFCTPSLGRKDIFAIAFLESVEALSGISFQLKGLKGVRDVKSSIWIDDYMLCPENFDLSRVVA
jgi:Lrp/AsnC family transcriptional regulator for asnA, asnC and gidA